MSSHFCADLSRYGKSCCGNGLRACTVQLVRTLGDFVLARIVYAGYGNKNVFSKRTGIARDTIDPIVHAEDTDRIPKKTQRSTLESIAGALGFREWHELLTAWRADDVFRGLPWVHVPLPREELAEIEAQAAKASMTTAAFIMRQLGVDGTKTPRPAALWAVCNWGRWTTDSRIRHRGSGGFRSRVPQSRQPERHPVPLCRPRACDRRRRRCSTQRKLFARPLAL